MEYRIKKTIVIIDYGVGNVHSVSNALTVLGYRNLISREPKIISQADAIVLPGVGAFSQAVTNLESFMLTDLLNEEVIVKQKPIIGICLGMQLLGLTSEECPGFAGFGWIKSDIIRLPSLHNVKVPHVGWNSILVNNDFIFKNLETRPHFYFDHSYFFNCDDQFTIGRCDYGILFPAAIASDNIIGVQFHPEKSQTNGLKLFRNIFQYFGF